MSYRKILPVPAALCFCLFAACMSMPVGATRQGAGSGVTRNADGSVTVRSRNGGTLKVSGGATLPAKCAQGEFFYRTGEGFRRCVSGTWTRAGIESVPLPSNIKVANAFPGTDVAAQINAADAALGGVAGEIWAFGGGSVSQSAVISTGHTLRLFPGTYQVTFDTSYGGAFLLKDRTAIVGNNWDTIIAESNSGVPTATFIVRSYDSTIPNVGSHSKLEDVQVRDLQFKGTAGLADDGIRQTVSLTNCHRCTVENLHLNGTHAIGIQLGGTAGLGHYAKDGRIVNNYLYGVRSQNIAVVNGDNIIIDGNRIKDPGLNGTGSLAAIDIEPNAANDRLLNIKVTNNEVDSRNSPNSVHAIAHQAGTVLNDNVLIANNKILGHTVRTTTGIMLTYGGTKNTIVRDNYIEGIAVSGLIVNGTKLLIENNTLVNAGGAGSPITLGEVSDSRIIGNKATSTDGAMYYMFETVKVTNNYIAGNEAQLLFRQPGAVSNGNTYVNNRFTGPSFTMRGIKHNDKTSNNTYEGNITDAGEFQPERGARVVPGRRGN